MFALKVWPNKWKTLNSVDLDHFRKIKELIQQKTSLREIMGAFNAMKPEKQTGIICKNFVYSVTSAINKMSTHSIGKSQTQRPNNKINSKMNLSNKKSAVNNNNNSMVTYMYQIILNYHSKMKIMVLTLLSENTDCIKITLRSKIYERDL